MNNCAGICYIRDPDIGVPAWGGRYTGWSIIIPGDINLICSLRHDDIAFILIGKLKFSLDFQIAFDDEAAASITYF